MSTCLTREYRTCFLVTVNNNSLYYMFDGCFSLNCILCVVTCCLDRNACSPLTESWISNGRQMYSMWSPVGGAEMKSDDHYGRQNLPRPSSSTASPTELHTHVCSCRSVCVSSQHRFANERRHADGRDEKLRPPCVVCRQRHRKHYSAVGYRKVYQASKL